jgi:hypothetical protein
MRKTVIDSSDCSPCWRIGANLGVENLCVEPADPTDTVEDHRTVIDNVEKHAGCVTPRTESRCPGA